MKKYKPSFYTVDSFGEKSLLTNLENNMKAFLNWGFLNIGAYVDVNIPQNNITNFSQHILKATQDQTRPARVVWQSPRKDWVHESGVCFKENAPLAFSGIYVEGNFYPAPTGNTELSYKVDYKNGQIIFDKMLPTNTDVQASYSYKMVQVYNSDEFPGWKEIQLDSSINTANQFNKYDKGEFAIPAEHRVQLPAVVIEIDNRESSLPFRLGDRSLIIKQDILFHILADNKEQKNKIVDILRLQKDRYIWLFDTNKIIEDKVYELNLDGTININGKNYEELTNDQRYRWKLSRISDIQVSDMIFYHMNLHGSVVRMTHEFIQNDFVPTCVEEGSVSVSVSESQQEQTTATSAGSGTSESVSVSLSQKESGSSESVSVSLSQKESGSSESVSVSLSQKESGSSESVSVSLSQKESGSSESVSVSLSQKESGSSESVSVSLSQKESGSSESVSVSLSQKESGSSESQSGQICISAIYSVQIACENMCYSNVVSTNIDCNNFCYSNIVSTNISCNNFCYSTVFMHNIDC